MQFEEAGICPECERDGIPQHVRIRTVETCDYGSCDRHRLYWLWACGGLWLGPRPDTSPAARELTQYRRVEMRHAT